MTATATIAPARPQHLRALSRANEVRLARAELKRRIARGELSVTSVIARPSWEAESMTLADLLCSQRRWGTTRCRKFLVAMQIPETKPVSALTARQRRAIVTALQEPAPAPEPEPLARQLVAA